MTTTQAQKQQQRMYNIATAATAFNKAKIDYREDSTVPKARDLVDKGGQLIKLQKMHGHELQPNSAVKLIMDYTKEDIKKGIAKDDTITSAIKGDWSLEKSAQAYNKRHGFTGGANT